MRTKFGRRRGLAAMAAVGLVAGAAAGLALAQGQSPRSGDSAPPSPPDSATVTAPQPVSESAKTPDWVQVPPGEARITDSGSDPVRVPIPPESPAAPPSHQTIADVQPGQTTQVQPATPGEAPAEPTAPAAQAPAVQAPTVQAPTGPAPATQPPAAQAPGAPAPTGQASAHQAPATPAPGAQPPNAQAQAQAAPPAKDKDWTDTLSDGFHTFAAKVTWAAGQAEKRGYWGAKQAGSLAHKHASWGARQAGVKGKWGADQFLKGMKTAGRTISGAFTDTFGGDSKDQVPAATQAQPPAQPSAQPTDQPAPGPAPGEPINLLPPESAPASNQAN